MNLTHGVGKLLMDEDDVVLRKLVLERKERACKPPRK